MTTTPILIERAPGLGWLASTPPSYPFRLAVTAPSEDEAVRLLDERLAIWEAIDDGQSD